MIIIKMLSSMTACTKFNNDKESRMLCLLIDPDFASLISNPPPN